MLLWAILVAAILVATGFSMLVAKPYYDLLSRVRWEVGRVMLAVVYILVGFAPPFFGIIYALFYLRDRGLKLHVVVVLIVFVVWFVPSMIYGYSRLKAEEDGRRDRDH